MLCRTRRPRAAIADPPGAADDECHDGTGMAKGIALKPSYQSGKRQLLVRLELRDTDADEA